MHEPPVSLSRPIRGDVDPEPPRRRLRLVVVLTLTATALAVAVTLAARWLDDTQPRGKVQVLQPLPNPSIDTGRHASTESPLAYPFSKDSPPRDDSSSGRASGSAAVVPPGVSATQWKALVAKASTRVDGPQEVMRLDAHYRFVDAVRQFRELARSSGERPSPGLVALARQIDAQLDTHVARRGMTLSDAVDLKAALLAVLEPDADSDAADAARERWVQAHIRARSDDLRDVMQRDPDFARRRDALVQAWHAQPPLRRDPKALERDLDRLHQELIGGAGAR